MIDVSPVVTAGKDVYLRNAVTYNRMHTHNSPSFMHGADSSNRKAEKVSESKSTAKTAVSKIKRIMSGKEVIMTPESVAALASCELASEFDAAQPTGARSDNPQSSQVLTPRPRRGYMLATLPILGMVVSGLHNNNSLSNYDPFSILPDIPGEPLPKCLLIRYCTFFSKF